MKATHPADPPRCPDCGRVLSARNRHMCSQKLTKAQAVLKEAGIATFSSGGMWWRFAYRGRAILGRGQGHLMRATVELARAVKDRGADAVTRYWMEEPR